MAYRVYIKNDYKPEIVWTRPVSRRRRMGYWSVLAAVPLLLAFIWFADPGESGTDIMDATQQPRTFTSSVTPYPEEGSIGLEITGPESTDQFAGQFSDVFTNKQPGSPAEAAVSTLP